MQLVLLHGLSRTSLSMGQLADVLRHRGGHVVHVVGYRSRRAPLRALAADVAERLDLLGLAGGGEQVGFVAHSMGGLVLRALPIFLGGFACGRSVLLGTPVRGSLLAQRLGPTAAGRLLFGPALADLSPERVAALPSVPGPFGVVAGTTWSPIVPGAFFVRAWARGRPSDSTVLVDETRSPDAVDHVTIAGVHTLLPHNREAHRQTLAFLARGRFDREAREADRPR